LDIVKLLLSKGSDPNEGEDAGLAGALGFAAHGGYDDIVKELIFRGANVNHADREFGITPLMIAARGGHATSTRELLLAGAKPETKNKSGHTAQDLAESQNHAGIVNMLRKAVEDNEGWDVATTALGIMRLSMGIYLANHEDESGYPRDFQTILLETAFYHQLPSLHITGHKVTNELTIYHGIGKKDGVLFKMDETKLHMLKDTGGWGYDPDMGLIFVDCKHADKTGKRWFLE